MRRDADDPLTTLLAPVTRLAGVGPSRSEQLGRLLRRPSGDVRCLDLLFHLPVGVIDRGLRSDAGGIAPGERATLRVVVRSHHRPRRRRQPHRVRCVSDVGVLDVVFFRARGAYPDQALPEGSEQIVSGRLTRHGGVWQMAHPELIATPEAHASRGPLQPVYRLTEGIGGPRLGRWIGQVLTGLAPLPEWLEADWLRRQGWPRFEEALHRLHRPRVAADVARESPARRRLAYDELLANRLALALVRERAIARGRTLRPRGELRRRLLASLPFRLTPAQRNALAAIDADMAAPHRMLHLLQGDVGSGKTVVALLAMLSAVEAGSQAALMVPTEILARQHAATIGRLLAPLDLAPVLLTGRERGPARRSVLERLARGAAPIVVGTHALFQAQVAFADLALAVVDEQHRFGVDQRLLLSAKGEMVDLLVMTATPIPRTLVLALYGDIAVSELRQKPPGRPPIRTRVLPLASLDRVLRRVERALDRGERFYWVCPAIEAGDREDAAAAETRFATLRERFGARVGLIHGRMAGVERDRAMAAFAAGQLRLLVATTVVEVGLDVPEAAAIVIEDAERFGLAQLHQLRGRVGRGGARAGCLLLHGRGLSETARARLEVMRRSDDGFEIAEQDLRLRGPGEVLGTRQSGLPALRLADLSVDADLLDAVGADVARVLARDPDLRGSRGRALQDLLRLFEREAAIAYLGSG